MNWQKASCTFVLVLEELSL
jgi:hypothetical protein